LRRRHSLPENFVESISRFAQFLAACEPDARNGAVITRSLLERYITWLASTPLSASSRSLSLIAPRAGALPG